MGSGHDPRHLETEQVFTRASILGWLDKHLEEAKWCTTQASFQECCAWTRVHTIEDLIEEVVLCP